MRSQRRSLRSPPRVSQKLRQKCLSLCKYPLLKISAEIICWNPLFNWVWKKKSRFIVELALSKTWEYSVIVQIALSCFESCIRLHRTALNCIELHWAALSFREIDRRARTIQSISVFNDSVKILCWNNLLKSFAEILCLMEFQIILEIHRRARTVGNIIVFNDASNCIEFHWELYAFALNCIELHWVALSCIEFWRLIVKLAPSET